MTTTTPNMNLVLPDVSVTAGPQWATLLNAAYALIDSHDHSPGKGVAITPSGLNISSDLSFVQNNATNLRSIRMFNNTTFTPGVSDKTCLYSLNNELYYIDGAGNNIQLTLNGVIDLSGTIAALTIKDSGFTLQYFGDVTRQMRFNLSAIPTATSRVMSVPDSGANDSFVTANATQTLTNKTLTSPAISAINTGSVTFTLPAADGTSGQVVQTNGSAVLSFVDPAGAAPANIAANDSNVVFTSSNNKYQVCNPTAARTYTMPSSLTAGTPWTFFNQATSWANVITIQTSGSNKITLVPPQGFVTIMPLTSTPTVAANWYVQDRQSKDVVYTPTFSSGFGTVTSISALASMKGDILYVKAFAIAGTVAAAVASVSIPSTVTISTSSLAINNTSAASGDIVGNHGAGNAAGFMVTAPATSTSVVYYANSFLTGPDLIATNGNNIASSSSGIYATFEVPVL